MVSLPGVRAVAFSVLAIASAAPVIAQCSTSWLPGGALPGVNGIVNALARWDPDGPGPATSLIVIGGRFTIAGDVQTCDLATYDPLTGAWGTLGSLPAGTANEVRAIAVLAGGDLVVAGTFPSIAGVSASNVARWSGATWAPLGSGTNGNVNALTPLANGDVVAGGGFGIAGGVIASRVARWNGSVWSPLGLGVVGQINSLLTLPNGDVVAGGFIPTAGGVAMNGVARWDGTSWLALGSGLGSGPAVTAITRLANGDLVATGAFSFVDPNSVTASCVARWDGTNWFGYGSLPVTMVNAAGLLPNGDLVIGGDFYSGALNETYVARWTGTTWTSLGGGTNGRVRAMLTLPGGDLIAGGEFTSAGTSGAVRLARWDSLAWAPLGSGSGASAGINAFTRLPNGDLVAGGAFLSIGGVTANRIARYDGVHWHPIGAGFNSDVRAVAVRPNGDIVAGGQFTSSGGVPIDNVARWDGATWQPMATGLPGVVVALAALPNGDVVAGGFFTTPFSGIARWNGTTWSAMPGSTQSILALAVLQNGDLAAASGAQVQRWNGSTWTPLGFAFSPDSILSLLVMPDGALVAGGNFVIAGGAAAQSVARWNGTIWQPVGNGFGAGTSLPTVRALHVSPGGDLLAGVSVTTAPATTAFRIARWTGSAWVPLAADQDAAIQALATTPNGDVAVGGAFTLVGGGIAAYFARLSSSCPASIASLGTGCAGSGGLDVLAPEGLPWAGSTFRALATGMPLSGFAVGVTGFGTTSVPLQSVLPQAVAGCSLFASPDVLSVLVPSGGSVEMQTPIPASAALAGRTLHQQVVPFELGAGGSVVAVTSSNALSLTIGVFQ